MNTVITIGREFGSGGREVGKRLADILGIAYYDKEIITEIAQKTDIAAEYVNRVVERNPVASYPITIGRTFYPVSDPHADINNKIYAEQSNILREMAEKSDCVIVGRCADYILRDLNPFKVFVYSDMASKVARCRVKGPENEDLSDRELIRHIKNIDRDRARYYKFFTGWKWGDKLNYNICVNTTDADIKVLAEALAKLIKP